MTDREKLIELLTEYYGADPSYYDVDAPSIADHLIANGVVVREKGENLRKDTPSLFECSKCGWSDWDTYTGDTSVYNFCPNCGADMRKGEDDG